MRFVPVRSLQAGMVVGKDIITHNTAAMIKKGIVLSAQSIDYLSTHGFLGAYISDLLSEDIEIQETISDKVLRAGIDAIAEENIGQILSASASIVTEIIDADNISVDMIDLRSFDDYTYHHSVNVAVYAVAVGKKMGLTPDELSMLSQAAICHDLGKMEIPAEIINKPDKLTDEEYEVIKTHPQKSFDILSKNFEISSRVKQAVLMHHENENGSGYPLHKSSEDIPLFAKIIHAVDVYDALTSKRPYKEPYSPSAAYDYMDGGCGILFDKSIVDIMTQVIPIYPPGVDVLLSDGNRGVVAGHTKDPKRPIIKLVDAGKKINLSDPENKSIFIVKSGIMLSDYVGEVELLNEKRNKASNERFKILVVDDMSISLLQTKGALGPEYDITTVLSGLDALKHIDSHGAPDLFIVDIEMPGMNGYALVKTLKNKGLGHIPVIFLTAKADKETVMQCISLGATDYIVKPAVPVYLRERVKIALKQERE